MKPDFITTSRGYQVAYHASQGEGTHVLFCPGYRSDMNSTKATALAEWCAARSIPLIRFDYFAHGKSDGDFIDFTIGAAMADALDVIDQVNPENLIIIGSSMGAWVALHAALERKACVRGLIGIASAPDFTEALMYPRFSPEQRRQLEEDGVVWAYSEIAQADYPISKKFIEEARTQLILDDIIGLDIPVHLLHGQADVDVPWETSIKLASQIMSDEVTITLIKDGDHRLNRPTDLALTMAALERMLAIR